MRLLPLIRCPHCSIAYPRMTCAWDSNDSTARADGGTPYVWRLFLCSACGGAVTTKSLMLTSPGEFVDIYPGLKSASSSITEKARSYLNQAYESIGTPDGAVMLASSAVDAMLKDKGYVNGSLYQRIKDSADDHLITEEMKAWAHEVRLAGNIPRHADIEEPHATIQDAEKVILFADALANYLYVIPALVKKGRDIS